MTPSERTLRKDPSTSFWLLEALESTAKRDPLDALRDAEALVAVLADRADVALHTGLTR